MCGNKLPVRRHRCIEGGSDHNGGPNSVTSTTAVHPHGKFSCGIPHTPSLLPVMDREDGLDFLSQ